MIWIVFLALRRFDRWLHKYILRKPYVYILPAISNGAPYFWCFNWPSSHISIVHI